MQATARLHNQVANVITPETVFIFDNTIAFDATNHMLNPNLDPGDSGVFSFLVRCQGTAPWFLGWLKNLNLKQVEPLEASILE